MRNFETWLEMYWVCFLARFKISEDRGEPVFEEIRNHYAESHRSYHGLKHPVLLLDELQTARQRKPEWFIDSKQDAAIELAIWDHDSFYDVRAKDNEERSAERAFQHARDLGFSLQVGGRAKKLVLATKHIVPPEELAAQIVVDIDLSLLAAPWANFAQDSQNIRREYAHVSDRDFKNGQRDFLTSMLKRPRIYGTDYFHEKFETLARENLERSLREQFAP